LLCWPWTPLHGEMSVHPFRTLFLNPQFWEPYREDLKRWHQCVDWRPREHWFYLNPFLLISQYLFRIDCFIFLLQCNANNHNSMQNSLGLTSDYCVYHSEQVSIKKLIFE
jgi:hypothetical protein